MINKIPLLAIPILLTGCSLFTYTDTAVFLKGYMFGYEEDHISKDQYDSMTASFANLKIGRGISSTVVLAYIKEGTFEWRSADNISIFTDNGVISKVTGLQSDITFSGTNILNIELLDQLLDEEFESFVGFSDPFLYRSVMVNVVHKSNREVTLNTPNGPIIANLYTHKFHVPSIGWSGTNNYFIDKNGLTIRAEQDIHPFLPRFTINYFYKFN